MIGHNPHYANYEIDDRILATLPEDDIPIEILAGVMQNDDDGIIDAEKDSYVPDYNAPLPNVFENGK